MASKEAILAKVRSAIADVKNNGSAAPPLPKIWEPEHILPAALSERFRENLEAVKGEFVLCTDLSDAADKMNALLNEIGAKNVAAAERPLCRAVVEQLNGIKWTLPPQEPENIAAADLSAMDAALVSPEYLLSDTGSCLFAAPTAFDRLLTYITPVSLVVASESMLRENLPMVEQELEPQLKAAQSGEFVIVTGPSRTADIEKILVLGVHGPRRVIVFVVQQA